MNLFYRLSSLACLVAVASASPSFASEQQTPSDEKGQQVEFFQAMKDGDIAVQFIARDAKQANVIIENKTKKPLKIKLPEAFAGVPVLAQFNNNNLGGGRNNNFGGGGGGFQGVGGGLGGFGGGGLGGFGGGGLGGGFFNVPPAKVGKIKVPCVCLEHGKKDPNPRIQYKIVPIESFTDNQEVIEVCKMIGRREISQNIAQAAAWHLASGLSWRELAQKDRVRLRNGYREKWFNPRELAVAVKAAGEAHRRADKIRTRKSQADSLSKS